MAASSVGGSYQAPFTGSRACSNLSSVGRSFDLPGRERGGLTNNSVYC